MTDQIRAPWTSEQVAALEQFQTASGMHPFTCGAERHALAPRLVPSHSGWYCPDPDCDYRQDWAHAFMAQPDAWPRPFADLRQPAATEATGPVECPPGVHSIFDPCPGDCGKPVDDEPSDASWTQLEARAFNAVLPALKEAGAWLPMSVRRKVARAVLAEILGPIDSGTDTATWTAVRAIQLMNEAGQERDTAQAALERVRKAIADRRADVADYEAENPPSGWSDGVANTCDRIEEALNAQPPQCFVRAEEQP